MGYWKDLTGDQVGYSPLQEVGERFPQMSHQQLTSAVQLVLDGEVRSGAYAVFTALAALPREQLRESRKHAAVKLLRQIPAIGPIRSALLVAFVRGQRTWSRLGSTSG